jgi:excisionase family DNA binding protein
MNEQLLKVADVAKLPNMSHEYVQLIAVSGEIPCVRVEVKIFRFRRQDVEAFMERVKTQKFPTT